MCDAEELRAKRKKQLKKDTATKLKSLVDEVKPFGYSSFLD